jgi:catechol 2,3-dioxygenase-like lactoylglutathione lyase family enzyme
MALDMHGLCPLLSVFDMATSLRFYRDVLGFEIVGSSDPEPDGHIDWCWLSKNDAAIMLNTVYDRERRPPAPDPARIAAHGDTQVYIGCEDLEGACEYLKTAGIQVKGPMVRPFGMKQLFFKDPDGYELCLQWKV